MTYCEDRPDLDTTHLRSRRTDVNRRHDGGMASLILSVATALRRPFAWVADQLDIKIDYPTGGEQRRDSATLAT